MVCLICKNILQKSKKRHEQGEKTTLKAKKTTQNKRESEKSK